MNRRHFVQTTLASFASFSLSSPLLANAAMLDKIGVQLWSLPKLLQSNFDETIPALRQMGFTEFELYGPYPFSTDQAKKWWEGIAKQVGFSVSGFYGRTPEDFGKRMKSAGIDIPSIHCDLDTLRTNMEGIAQAAQHVGYTYITLPAIPEDERKRPDDYKRLADDFNRIGASAKKYGLKFTYHNHGYGFAAVNGEIPIYTLIDHTDPSLVFLEMDLYWTVAGGADPVELLKKYPGRYHLMHVKDMKEKKKFSGDGGTPQQWMELFPFMTTAGNGVLDLKTILATAKKSGTRHFFVEQDAAADPAVELKASADYLKKL